jgi:SAM-dependent methyltransferase
MTIDYNNQATKWHRNEPKHRSDFCGRPEVYQIVKALGKNKVILDIGCGEGYFTRQIRTIADRIVGLDLSEEMIRLAEKDERIEYHIGDAREMPFEDSAFDLCVGNYITNYFKPDELPKFYKELARVTKDKFVLLMPHPIFELTTDYGEAIQYEIDEYDYIESRGKLYKAKLKTVQGDTLEVGLFHSTLEDHFKAISSAGLRVNEIREPIFPREIAEKHNVFRKMGGKVACMILVGEKPN